VRGVGIGVLLRRGSGVLPTPRRGRRRGDATTSGPRSGRSWRPTRPVVGALPSPVTRARRHVSNTTALPGGRGPAQGIGGTRDHGATPCTPNIHRRPPRSGDLASEVAGLVVRRAVTVACNQSRSQPIRTVTRQPRSRPGPPRPHRRRVRHRGRRPGPHLIAHRSAHFPGREPDSRGTYRAPPRRPAAEPPAYRPCAPNAFWFP